MIILQVITYICIVGLTTIWRIFYTFFYSGIQGWSHYALKFMTPLSGFGFEYSYNISIFSSQTFNTNKLYMGYDKILYLGVIITSANLFGIHFFHNKTKHISIPLEEENPNLSPNLGERPLPLQRGPCLSPTKSLTFVKIHAIFSNRYS